MRPLLIIFAVVLAVLHPLLALAAVLAVCGVLSALIARAAVSARAHSFGGPHE